MNKKFVQQQKEQVLRKLSTLKGPETQEKRQLFVLSQFLSSLLNPEGFTENEREDLRKLALELGYKEDSSFVDWKSLAEIG